MDARAWVAGCVPPPPPSLAAAVDRALGASPAGPDVTEHCLRAAEHVLARVLANGSPASHVGREAARDTGLDLLVADALVTYAFEAASDTPGRLDEVARDAMARLSRVGAPSP